MIPAGCQPIDRAGIAALHGLEHLNGPRRPWAAPDHPQPLTVGRPSRGRPRLWDRAQAHAYAAGEPIPAPPTHPDPEDLLDRREAAQLAGVDAVAWERDIYRGRVPPPDAAPHHIPHWHRRTVLDYRDQRARPRTGPHAGGRPPGVHETTPRRDTPARVAALLDEDPSISTAHIARRLAIHYTTAHRHRKTLETHR